MAVTHDDIAALAGVSRTAVSKVLNRSRGIRVSEEKQRQIWEIAREMGYQPRGMTTHNIGLLVSLDALGVQNDFSFVKAVERHLCARGYRLMLVSPELPSGQKLTDVLNPKTVDGLLLDRWDGGHFENLLQRDLPCILLAEEDDAPDHVEQIGTDLRGTMLNAFDYLSGRGHRRIALLSGIKDGFYRRLERAAQEAAQEAALASVELEVISVYPQLGAAAVRDLMAGPDPVTAVIVADVERALLLCAGLHTAGVHVPEELSVLSLFDHEHCADVKPPLTATTAGGAQRAKIAVERLLQKITVPETIPRHVFVPGEIVERESVADVT